MGNDTQALTAEQVKDYLAEHVDFFQQQPEVLDTLQLSPSPKGTVSLVQRQTERLQGKNKQLHQQLQALIENARQNNELQYRIHQLCLQLMDASSLDALLPMLMNDIKKEFKADSTALRLFYTGDTAPELSETDLNVVQQHADDQSLRVFEQLLSRQAPLCGRLSKAQNELLFPQQAEQVQSVVCLPLGHDPCAGILAIASYDEGRFHADMATDYLQFLGEVTMRLLRLHLHG